MSKLVYTTTVYWRKPKDLKLIDVTVKSAAPEFRCVAPTWDMVLAYKHGKMSESEYTKLYLGILEKNRSEILAAFTEPDIALACYCRPNTFCHRVLLAKWLEENAGYTYAGEVRR